MLQLWPGQPASDAVTGRRRDIVANPQKLSFHELLALRGTCFGQKQKQRLVFIIFLLKMYINGIKIKKDTELFVAWKEVFIARDEY